MRGEETIRRRVRGPVCPPLADQTCRSSRRSRLRVAHGWNMTDRKPLGGDPNDTPEDVATLYSWANLHGAKYRDFSAARAQTREKARQRMQDALAEEREKVDADRVAEVRRAAEAARAAEAEHQAELAGLQAAQRSMQQAAAMQQGQGMYPALANPALGSAAYPQPPVPQYPQGPNPPYAQPRSTQYPPMSGVPYGQPAYAQPPSTQYPQPPAGAYPQGPAAQYPQPAYPQPAPSIPAQPGYRGYGPLEAIRTTVPPVPPASARLTAPYGENLRIREAQPASQEDLSRPAWLQQMRPESTQPAQPALPPVHAGTLQGSRDRLTARWYALKGAMDHAQGAIEPAPSPATMRPPVMAVFSLAGGVGKTSLVATLARALSSRGERVLLIDTAAFGLLPFFFGARDQRPGVLRTFTPPGATGDAPIQLVAFDTEMLGPESANSEPMTQEILSHARGANRILVDIATASAGTTRRILRLAPSVLVPIVPDMSSVMSVSSIDEFFRRHPSPTGRPIQPCYLLNQFDPTLPLHLDVREVLREQIGDRLLPFVMRRAPAVSEALAEGMTVMDYAPNSAVAEDFASLAQWTKSIAAPMSSSYRGVRWSER